MSEMTSRLGSSAQQATTSMSCTSELRSSVLLDAEVDPCVAQLGAESRDDLAEHLDLPSPDRIGGIRLARAIAIFDDIGIDHHQLGDAHHRERERKPRASATGAEYEHARIANALLRACDVDLTARELLDVRALVRPLVVNVARGIDQEPFCR